MKTLSAILLLSLLTCANAADTPGGGGPYHPFRKIVTDKGTRYYSVQPIYVWLKKKGERRGSDPLVTEKRPMPDWMGGGFGDLGEGLQWYQVDSITPEGIFVSMKWSPSFSAPTYGPRIIGFLKNYPGKESLVDGQSINFLALRVGTYTYEDVSGGSHTVPLLDYGTPYDPQQLVRQKAADAKSSSE